MRTGFSGSCLTAKAWLGVMLAALVAVSLARVPADARPSSSKSGDPAVAFMQQVALPDCPPLVALQLPLTRGATRCGGRGISGDGATVVGVCDDLDVPGEYSLGEQAVRWTIARGAEVLPAEGNAEALAVSADGAIVVGRDALGPFIWTGNEMLHPGAELDAAQSISADGRVVVGGSTRAWLWTAEAGFRGEFWLLVGLVVVGIVWYLGIKSYRRKDGIDISLAFKQIPIE